MDRLEDIMEQARAYLKGQMNEEERQAFEQTLEANPSLREELEVARMIMGGAEELARRRRWRKIKKWSLFVGLPLLLLIAAAILYFLLSHTPSEGTSSGQVTEQMIQARGQAGGKSLNRISDRAYSVAWTGDNSLAMIGIFEERAEFGKDSLQSWGGKDIFLTSYDLTRGYQWTTQMGGFEPWEMGRALALSPDGGLLITGTFGGTAFFGDTIITSSAVADFGMNEFFIASLSAEGKVQWVSHAGGNLIAHKQTGSNIGNCITADAQGNVIAAGTYLGAPSLEGVPLPPGGPNEDLFLAKYTPDGRLLWVKAATGTYMVIAEDIATDKEGHIYLTGYFGHQNLSGSANFGDATLQSFGGRDLFLAKYSPNGKLLWVQQAGASLSENGHDTAQGLALDSQNNCYITGTFKGTARFGPHQVTSAGEWDAFVAKCSPDGEFLWARSAGGPGRLENGNAVIVDKEGSAYVAGRFTGTSRFGDTTLTSNGAEDLFVAKINEKGNFEWAMQAGGALPVKDTDAGMAIDINSKDNIIVTGYFSGTAIIGGTSYTSRGREDMIFIRMDKEGNILSAAVLP